MRDAPRVPGPLEVGHVPSLFCACCTVRVRAVGLLGLLWCNAGLARSCAAGALEDTRGLGGLTDDRFGSVRRLGWEAVTAFEAQAPWRLRIVVMPKPVAQKLFSWSGFEAKVVSVESEGLDETLESLAMRKLPMANTWVDTVLGGEGKSSYETCNKLGYIKEFHFSQRDAAAIADPMIAIAKSGLVVSMCAAPESSRTQQQLEAKWGVVKMSMPTHRFGFGGTIHTPMLNLRTVKAPLSLQSGMIERRAEHGGAAR